MTKSVKRFLFYSQYAFYEPLYRVFEHVTADFALQPFVITYERTPLPKAYVPAGYLTQESAGLTKLPDFVTVIPNDLPLAGKRALLEKSVRKINPDYIWAHEEPNNDFVNQMLRWYYRQRTPRIVVYLAENLWPLPGGRRAEWARFRRRRLWRRYNGVLACGSKSADAIRPYGMPESVPISIAGVPTLAPPEVSGNVECSFLPQKEEGEVFIGFAGRITAAKGWRVLLAAIAELPERYKCLIAGGGDEESELRMWCHVPPFRTRVHYLGTLEKERLWSFYRSLDVIVVPSLTTNTWKEQFGVVLAEGMACGVPVIGSDSGAIPEVIGDCGIVVEENNPMALARAIQELTENPDRRASYVKAGLERFTQEYSTQAYAAKLAAALGLKARAHER